VRGVSSGASLPPSRPSRRRPCARRRDTAGSTSRSDGRRPVWPDGPSGRRDASWALRPGRKPKLRSENDGSKMGLKAWLNACWRTQSMTVGTPNSRSPPSGLGTITWRTGWVGTCQRRGSGGCPARRPSGEGAAPLPSCRRDRGRRRCARRAVTPGRGCQLRGRPPRVHDPGGVRGGLGRRRIGAAL
jgi:hypothetical protein